MSRSETRPARWAACALLALSASGAVAATPMSNNPNDMFTRSHMKPSVIDKDALREEVDETQGLFDVLAHETRRRGRELLTELPKQLRGDYKLPEAEGRARKCLGLAEEVISLQDAIKAQQAVLKAAAADAQDAEERKLLGLQSDLMSTVEDLRNNIRSLHTDLKEDKVRDLRNWLMVSEGVLRRQREDDEAQAASLTPTAEAQPISAEAVTPPAAAQAVAP